MVVGALKAFSTGTPRDFATGNSFDLAPYGTALLMHSLAAKGFGPGRGSLRPSLLVIFNLDLKPVDSNMVPDHDCSPDISAVRLRTASESPERVLRSNSRSRRV